MLFIIIDILCYLYKNQNIIVKLVIRSFFVKHIWKNIINIINNTNNGSINNGQIINNNFNIVSFGNEKKTQSSS
jgi:hypothetical protein